MANVKSGTLSAAGAATSGDYWTARRSLSAGAKAASFQFTISAGTPFVGTVRLERSSDSGATFEPVTYVDGTVLEWTVPVNTTLEELENGAVYRVNFVSRTSGSVVWRLAQ